MPGSIFKFAKLGRFPMNHALNAQRRKHGLKTKINSYFQIVPISKSYQKYVTFIIKFIHNNKCYGGVKCYLKCIFLFRKFAT
jgi:hypothetical protein